MNNLEQSLDGLKLKLAELFHHHPMGQHFSQRVKGEAEHVLDSSEAFQEAVEWSFAEGGGATHGLHAWQLYEAIKRIYLRMGPMELPFAELWMRRPPSQEDVDEVIEKGSFFIGRDTLSLEAFRHFARSFFVHFAITRTSHRLAIFIPAGTAFVFLSTGIVKRIPIVGSVYRGLGAIIPKLALGIAVGVAAAFQMR